MAKRIRKTLPSLFSEGAEVVCVQRGRPGTVLVRWRALYLEFTAYHEIVYVRVGPVEAPKKLHELDLVICIVEGRRLQREPFVGLLDFARRALPQLERVASAMERERFIALDKALNDFYRNQPANFRVPT